MGMFTEPEPGMPYKVVIKQGHLTKSTDDAAGWDIHCTDDFTIVPGESRLVKTGLITEMFGCHGLIRDRSGLASKRITTRAGVIDAKYPKEWGVVLVNESNEPMVFRGGDRIAQVIFFPEFRIDVIGGIQKSVTRTGGFGSTG